MIWLIAIFILLLVFAGYPRYPRPTKGGRIEKYSQPEKSTDPIRVVTYNVHGCKGQDNRRDVFRIAKDIEGAHIAALQEIHDSWYSPRQLERLSEILKLNALKAPTRVRWFRPERNNGLLSLFPFCSWAREPLMQSTKHHHFRNLTVSKLTLPQPLWVLFTHLSTRVERSQQLEYVFEQFMHYSPAILVGDFNTTEDDPQIQQLLSQSEIIDALGKYLKQENQKRIDWILCRGLQVHDAGVVDSGSSDHPLYWCDISVPKSGENRFE